MSENIIVKAKIKEVAKDMNVSSDFADVLNSKVREIIQEAIIRAKANDRKTVMGKDL